MASYAKIFDAVGAINQYDLIANANIPLTGTVSGNPVDGISITNGMYVVLAAQTTASQNGVYTAVVVTGNYTLTLFTSLNTTTTYNNPILFIIAQGTINTNHLYQFSMINSGAFFHDLQGGTITPQNIQNQSFIYGIDSGVDDAFIITPTPAITSLTDGLLVVMSTENFNNTTTPTLQVNALTPTLIMGTDAQPLLGNGISIGANGGVFQFIYSAANSAFMLLNPNGGTVTSATNIENGYFNFYADTGVADAYVTNSPAGIPPAGNAFGSEIRTFIQNTNLTTTPTLTVNGGGPYDIILINGGPLVAGDLVAGGAAIFINQGDGIHIQLLNPAISSGNMIGPGTSVAHSPVLFRNTNGLTTIQGIQNTGKAYVDVNNGDDTNSGLNINDPLKTINQAIGNGATYIYILDANGTSMPGFTTGNVNITIFAETPTIVGSSLISQGALTIQNILFVDTTTNIPLTSVDTTSIDFYNCTFNAADNVPYFGTNDTLKFHSCKFIGVANTYADTVYGVKFDAVNYTFDQLCTFSLSTANTNSSVTTIAKIWHTNNGSNGIDLCGTVSEILVGNNSVRMCDKYFNTTGGQQTNTLSMYNNQTVLNPFDGAACPMYIIIGENCTLYATYKNCALYPQNSIFDPGSTLGSVYLDTVGGNIVGDDVFFGNTYAGVGPFPDSQFILANLVQSTDITTGSQFFFQTQTNVNIPLIGPGTGMFTYENGFGVSYPGNYTTVASSFGGQINNASKISEQWNFDSTTVTSLPATIGTTVSAQQVTIPWQVTFPTAVFNPQATALEATANLEIGCKIVSVSTSSITVEVQNPSTTTASGPVTIYVDAIGN